MKRAVGTVLVAALWLAACDSKIPVAAPASEELSGEAIAKRADGPPTLPEGACWGQDTIIPAVIETVTNTVRDQPGLRTGKDTQTASDSSTAKQRDHQDVFILIPCADQMIPDSTATLQRALKARGYYAGAVTGQLSLATLLAVRRYQAGRGLDSAVLSLKAAQALGLAVVDLSKHASP